MTALMFFFLFFYFEKSRDFQEALMSSLPFLIMQPAVKAEMFISETVKIEEKLLEPLCLSGLSCICESLVKVQSKHRKAIL